MTNKSHGSIEVDRERNDGIAKSQLWTKNRQYHERMVCRLTIQTTRFALIVKELPRYRTSGTVEIEVVDFDRVELDQLGIVVRKGRSIETIVAKIDDNVYRILYYAYFPSKTFDYPSNGAGIMDFRRHDTTIVQVGSFKGK